MKNPEKYSIVEFYITKPCKGIRNVLTAAVDAIKHLFGYWHCGECYILLSPRVKKYKKPLKHEVRFSFFRNDGSTGVATEMSCCSNCFGKKE